ncbi:MAG: carbamoyltransferase [Bacteroidetes bacterium]|nr:carbamoyltransferase [Bacteroidota bacterium]
MIVLGLNHGELNSSAAIVKDGKVIAGAAEERFNRQKRTKDFPIRSIEYCLSESGITMGECDYFTQAWNPAALWNKFNPLASGTRILKREYFYTVPDNLYKLLPREEHDWVKMEFEADKNMSSIYYIQHHIAHAANAFYLSNFEEAAILTCDFRGEHESAIFCAGRGNKIEKLQKLDVPNSLGMFYSTFTELLGYEIDSDEWKVMALSAFDVDSDDIYKKIKSTIGLTENGFFELDQSYYKAIRIDQPNLYTDKLVKLLGGKVGSRNDQPSDWHYAVAKAMQQVSEDVCFHMLKHLHDKTGMKNLCISGGFFMNSVFNGKILENSPFENYYVSYAPSDLGNSIGAALYVSHHIHDIPRDDQFNSSLIGPSYSEEEIEITLKRRKISYSKTDAWQKKVAEILAGGDIVALIEGKMEFGERALGNRSILADPRKSDMKDKINAMIKYRESYRPFAPSALKGSASKYFDVPEGFESHYMEQVVQVRKEMRDIIPAVTHVDGSARLQTVDEQVNENLYKIISEFEKLTDVPIVLNTSFNVNGEPIVLSPDDALTTFFNSGLEHLFLGPYYISKLD